MSSSHQYGAAGELDDARASDLDSCPCAYGGLFDIFTEGVAVCAEDGCLVYRNAALAQMCECDPEQARVLAGICALARDTALAAASGTSAVDDAEAPESARTRTVRTANARYILRATTVRGGSLLGADATLVSAERIIGGLPSLETLRARFALTMAEARIVPLLAARHTNAQIARALGISPHTVRHHAERAFLKLCVHRRTEIAARLARYLCI